MKLPYGKLIYKFELPNGKSMTKLLLRVILKQVTICRK